jgi:hypothetical protein
MTAIVISLRVTTPATLDRRGRGQEALTFSNRPVNTRGIASAKVAAMAAARDLRGRS